MMPVGKLTTVAQDFEAIARGCVSMLVGLIEKREETAVDMIIPSKFIIGNTVK